MAKGMHHPLGSVVEYVAEIPIGPTVRVYRIRTPGGWIVTSRVLKNPPPHARERSF